MPAAIKNYVGMVAIALAAVLVIGAIALRIDRGQSPDLPTGIAATPLIGDTSSDLLVDANWLQQHMDEVDHVFDLSDIRQYNQGHIPGARHIAWQDAMSQHAANYGEPDAISRQSHPDDVFGVLNLNVAQDARIILYDAHASERAAWMLWVMTINGYRDVHVLDGGIQAWIGSGGELSTNTAEAPEQTVVATPAWNEAVVWNRERLLGSLDDPAMHLVDTRSAEELRDTVNGTIRQGHIPGAVIIPTVDVMRADGTFKSPAELEALFASHGIDPGNRVVVYSLFSTHSGRMWLAFQLAGYGDVAVFQEGYAGWGYDPELPLSSEPFATPQIPAAAMPASSPIPQESPITTPTALPTEGPTDLTGSGNPFPSASASQGGPA